MLKIIKAAAVTAAVAVGVADAFGTRCGASALQQQQQQQQQQQAKRRFPEATEMPDNLKVVIFGDSGNGNGQIDVLNMAKAFGAEFILHLGDFDYDDEPDTFFPSIWNIMGRDYPYFAAIGNNDEDAWDGNGGYLELLTEQLENANVTQYCTGDVGENYACYYKGLYFVLSGVGTQGSGHVGFVEDAFDATPARWKLCGWHKNQYLMQIGTKEDETGYDIYDTCRSYGAIVATAHFHSYSRTYTMSSFAQQRYNDSSNDVTLAPGQSFAVVSAVGGKDVNDWDPDLASNPWWAAVGAQDNDLDDGALFCTFKVNGDPSRAECYFESRRDGGVYDNFTIFNNVPADRVVRAADPCRQPFYELAVADGDDDFVVVSGSTVDAAGAHLPLDAGPQQRTAFRFVGVPVPANATAVFAQLQLYGVSTVEDDDSDDADLELWVRVELASDAAAVQDTWAGRTWSAPVVWSPSRDAIAVRTVWHSANLASLINEVVRLPGWAAGHSLLVTVEGAADRATTGLAVASADFAPCKAPTLVIELELSC